MKENGLKKKRKTTKEDFLERQKRVEDYFEKVYQRLRNEHK